MLGKPGHASLSSGVSLWVYEHEACRLTLRFHFSVRDNELRTLGHEIDSALAEGVPESICLHILGRGETRIAANEGAAPFE